MDGDSDDGGAVDICAATGAGPDIAPRDAGDLIQSENGIWVSQLNASIPSRRLGWAAGWNEATMQRSRALSVTRVLRLTNATHSRDECALSL